jgi:hypothetical protein
METPLQIFIMIAAAAVSAGVPVLLAWLLPMLSANIHQKDVALLADGAARAAGRVIVAVAEQMARPGASLRSVVAVQAASEVANLKKQFPETITKLAVPDATLAAMIQGEVGKRLNATVEQPAQPAAGAGLRQVSP